MRCVCGNVLEQRPFEVRVSPCRCTEPGPGRRTVPRESFLNENEVTPTQYAQRKRLGLPVVTEIEKSAIRDARHGGER